MNFKHLEAYWFVLCESRDVGKQPRTFQLLGQDVVAYRTEAGEAVAFIDRCPHRNVKMSEGRLCEGRLVCQFHGWEFDTEGRCVHIPGMTPRDDLRAPNLKKHALVEEAGLVFVRLGAGSERRPHVPGHIADPALATTTHRTHLGCGAIDIAENFLDPFHTPFVHAGIIRTAGVRCLNRIAPVHLDDGLEVVYTKDQRQSGFVARFGRQIDREMGRFLMPGIIELEYHAEGALEFINTMYITPRTQTSSSLYFKASLRPFLLPPFLVYGIAGLAIKYALLQDRVILEKQTRRAEELGGRFYANTELDIVRRQLENLYAGNGERIALRPLEALI